MGEPPPFEHDKGRTCWECPLTQFLLGNITLPEFLRAMPTLPEAIPPWLIDRFARS